MEAFELQKSSAEKKKTHIQSYVSNSNNNNKCPSNVPNHLTEGEKETESKRAEKNHAARE